jgi:hypothetical protein
MVTFKNILLYLIDNSLRIKVRKIIQQNIFFFFFSQKFTLKSKLKWYNFVATVLSGDWYKEEDILFDLLTCLLQRLYVCFFKYINKCFLKTFFSCFPISKPNTVVSLLLGLIIREETSLEGYYLVEFSYLSASDIWPHKRGGL